MGNEHKTAMSRVAASAPMKWLASQERIVGNALDYGCGKAYDAREYCMKSYDPHYYPIMPDGRFDTITCNYVLNVIKSPVERLRVLTDIRDRLARGGKAYITVRNDRRALCGITAKGTWQGHIMLRLPVVRSCAGYVIYELDYKGHVSFNIQEARTYDK